LTTKHDAERRVWPG